MRRGTFHVKHRRYGLHMVRSALEAEVTSWVVSSLYAAQGGRE